MSHATRVSRDYVFSVVHYKVGTISYRLTPHLNMLVLGAQNDWEGVELAIQIDSCCLCLHNHKGSVH